MGGLKCAGFMAPEITQATALPLGKTGQSLEAKSFTAAECLLASLNRTHRFGSLTVLLGTRRRRGPQVAGGDCAYPSFVVSPKAMG